MNQNKEVVIYTDGACSGNPGAGGWAAILTFGDKRKEISGGYKVTTNNRMELMAAIESLKQIKTGNKYKIKLISDSRYVVDAINKGWLTHWELMNWKRKSTPIPNADLWKELTDLLRELEVEFQWVEGHAGHTENERCDTLARAAASVSNLPRDTFYEANKDREGINPADTF
jgi:ribonuclease HI